MIDRPAPYWKSDPRVWPAIAEALSKPWPIEAAAEDLQWWADQIVAHGATLPGRPTLAKRWGWRDCQVRKLLLDVDPMGIVEASTPARRQPDASATPARRQPHNGSNGSITGDTPARRQPDASAAPAERHTRVVDRATEQQSTDQHLTPAAGAADGGQPLLLSTTPPATPKPTALIAEQIERVYEAYKAHHPRKALKPSAGEQRAIRDRLRELVDSNVRRVTDPEAVRAAGDALLTMIAWVHTAPDAAWWRDNKRLGLEAPLMKLDKFAERMASADEWATRGRPGQPSTDTAPRLSPTEQDRADAERFAADADRRAELRKARLAKLAASPPPLRRSDP